MKEEGNLFTKDKNLGRYLIIPDDFKLQTCPRENDRLFIVKKTPNIPKGAHLKWDHDDRNILQHPWLAT